MDTYIEPEIEEVAGPMDDSDILIDGYEGYDKDDIALQGKWWYIAREWPIGDFVL